MSNYLIIDRKTRVKIKAGTEKQWEGADPIGKDKYQRVFKKDAEGITTQLIIIDRGEEKITPKGQAYIKNLAAKHKYKLDKTAMSCYEANAIINELLNLDDDHKYRVEYIPGQEVHP